MPVNVTPVKLSTQSPKFFNFRWQTKGNSAVQPVQLNSINLYMRKDQAYIDAPFQYSGGIEASTAAETLAQWWSCTSKETALMLCNSLVTARSMSLPTYDLFLGLTRFYRDRMRKGDQDNVVMESLVQFVKDLRTARPEFGSRLEQEFVYWMNIYRDPRFQAYAPQVIPETSRGWDLARVDNVAGLSVLAGYLTPEEHQEQAFKALSVAKEHFDSWYEYMLSFWWGRAIWVTSDGESYPELVDQILSADDVFSAAFTKDKSPWLRFPLHR